MPHSRGPNKKGSQLREFKGTGIFRDKNPQIMCMFVSRSEFTKGDSYLNLIQIYYNITIIIVLLVLTFHNEG